MIEAEHCPSCGWPTTKGSPCPRCSPTPGSGASAASTASSPTGTLIVVMLFLIGLFWIVLAALQIRAGLSIRPGGLALLIAIVGVWNLLVGGYTLSVIKEVVRRSCHVQGPLVLISIGGAGWAVFATIWLGGWFQLLLIPLHMGVGVLAWTNSAYFDSGRGRDKPPVRSPALARDGKIEAVSPVQVPEPPPPPPWEQPLLDTNRDDSVATMSLQVAEYLHGSRPDHAL